MKTYLIVLPDCTSFKKHRVFFYKRGPLIQGHKIGCPRLEHLLNYVQFGYDVIFVDNINVLDLALWAEKILKLNVCLCNFLKKHTLWSIDSHEN